MKFNLNRNIKNILESGQIFSYEYVDDHYRIYSADKACVAYHHGKQSTIVCQSTDEEYWHSYFNEKRFELIEKKILTSKNDFIRKCHEEAEGIVILKQDLWEMICSYIISQRNNIPAITKSLFKFRKQFGEKRVFQTDGLYFHYYTFPTAYMLKDITKEDLSALSFGYRDKYIIDAIRWYNNDYANCNFHNISSEEQTKQLMTIKGIGIKVANCISLFALNDFSRFPIDVWIQRILDSGKFTLEELDEYKDMAGYLNQIMYFYAIHHKNEF